MGARIIGQCFEDNITDCAQKKWKSNFYHLAVNGDECADVKWEVEIEHSEAWPMGVQILIAVLASCSLALCFVVIFCKSKKDESDKTEPLSDVEQNGGGDGLPNYED